MSFDPSEVLSGAEPFLLVVLDFARSRNDAEACMRRNGVRRIADTTGVLVMREASYSKFTTP